MEQLFGRLDDSAAVARQVASAEHRESVVGEHRRHVRTVRSAAWSRNRPRRRLAWLLLLILLALIALAARIDAAPRPEPSWLAAAGDDARDAPVADEELDEPEDRPTGDGAPSWLEDAGEPGALGAAPADGELADLDDEPGALDAMPADDELAELDGEPGALDAVPAGDELADLDDEPAALGVVPAGDELADLDGEPGALDAVPAGDELADLDDEPAALGVVP
ncbi:MAG TPA: hypothetical protein VGD37_21105, partial [Kofleriaceae bacterium]